jgi:hypothetical protein
VTEQTLRNWDASGKLTAKRGAGGQRYYAKEVLERFSLDLPKLGWAWAASAQAPEIPGEYYCERQDRFTSRLEKMALILLGLEIPEATVSLLIQAVGEIGDNSFAHNIGRWPDTPGIFFGYDLHRKIVVLADRGQGVRATLKQVRPEIETDREALTVAFTEVVSGRHPEKRGNGLKVVRRVAELGPMSLEYRSGLGVVLFGKKSHSLHVSVSTENVRGTYAILTF